jgi:hypothetical protein
MPSRAPISHHLDLYGYWLAKRGARAMPARSDIDPGDVPALLAHLIIIDRVDDQFRYRLVGTAVAEQFGHDLTGRYVGFYVSPAKYIDALRAIYQRVFTTSRPIFGMGEYKTKWETHYHASQLILPLSDDGTNANMAICARIACVSSTLKSGSDWPKGGHLRVTDVFEIEGTTDLEKRCIEWERRCLPSDAALQDSL